MVVFRRQFLGMQTWIVELWQVHFQAYRFNSLVDLASLQPEFLGDLLMDANSRDGQIRFVDGLNFLQFITITLVGLHFPPAWDVIPLAELLDDLLNSLLRYREFLGNLRANAVEFLWRCQFLVARLNLRNLLRRWHKWSGRRNLLALGSGRSWRLLLPWRFGAFSPFGTLLTRSARTLALGAATKTAFHWLARTISGRI